MNRIAMSNTESNRRIGFTLLELMVTVTIIAVLIAILLPFIEIQRCHSRRMSCSNNFKQIGLAIHNYYSTYKQLPTACGGTGPTPGKDDWSNQRRLSGLIALTPYVEAGVTWSLISEAFETGPRPDPEDMPDRDQVKGGYYYHHILNELKGGDGPFGDDFRGYYFPAMGPAPWRAKDYPPWQMGFPTFRCPSDSNDSAAGQASLTNYAMCYGDGVRESGYEPGSWLEFRERNAVDHSQRGMFVAEKVIRFNDITDGLTNTIAMGEVVTYAKTRLATAAVATNVKGIVDNPSKCLKVADESGNVLANFKLRLTPDGKASRGGNWADGAISWSGFNTILPPNSPNCDTEVDHRLEGVFSASSHHEGGCHILMADGAVIFMIDSVDVGDTTKGLKKNAVEYAPESRYGLWGALGTINGQEDIEEKTTD